ncbi:MAG TPA: HAD-IA family hydrolase [Gaiellaceae bacterium]|nr:HAD-IA family hydrolase [Gaiellaceae bacterium]
MRYRAVIFDLWQTLVAWPVDGAKRMNDDLAAHFGAEPDRFRELWLQGRRDRERGPMEPHLRSLAVKLGFEGDLAAAATLRREWTLEHLVPRPDAVTTLEELRRRGHLLGMVSACSAEVPEVWARTPFAGLFDSTVFSCLVGVSKPDPRIYRAATDELGVEPSECLFVGDGANDELPGAERVGMTALQLRAPGEPLTEEGEQWDGPHVERLSDVLDEA